MNGFVSVLRRGEEIAATLLLSALTLVIGGQIVFRYCFNDPLAWSEELSQFLLICLAFVAATAVLKRGEHYSVDAFVNAMSPAVRRLVEVTACVVQLLLVLGLAYYSVSIARLYTGTTSVILKIPEEVKAYVMVYSFLSMAVHFAIRIAGLLRQAR
jgi:TRAP-type C4-dicarboxylate transport system permease small subunit